MTQNIQKNLSGPQLDRADTRVRNDVGLSGALRGFIDQIRSGDLGVLPVVVGLLLISTVFSALNPIFLAPNNLVNLLFDAAAVGWAWSVCCCLAKSICPSAR
jgi:D-xylose transport system permease protein